MISYVDVSCYWGHVAKYACMLFAYGWKINLGIGKNFSICVSVYLCSGYAQYVMSERVPPIHYRGNNASFDRF